MNKYTYKRTVVLKPRNESKVVIIDCGTGNLGSIKNMFKAVGIESQITRDLEKIKKAEKLVLPGVGAFDSGMENLKKMKIIPILEEFVLKKRIPILGICLGMQLMTEKSQEGSLPGLGWIKGETKKFNNGLKIPHMGWNTTKIEKNNKLVSNIPKDCRYYFVHSYYVECLDRKDILFTTEYGHNFVSAFSRGNIYGVQFHPEKSLRFGMQLLKNFGEIK